MSIHAKYISDEIKRAAKDLLNFALLLCLVIMVKKTRPKEPAMFKMYCSDFTGGLCKLLTDLRYRIWISKVHQLHQVDIYSINYVLI